MNAERTLTNKSLNNSIRNELLLKNEIKMSKLSPLSKWVLSCDNINYKACLKVVYRPNSHFVLFFEQKTKCSD